MIMHLNFNWRFSMSWINLLFQLIGVYKIPEQINSVIILMFG
jgi:hypothetical protein